MALVCKHGGRGPANWTMAITKVFPFPLRFHISFVMAWRAFVLRFKAKGPLTTGVQDLKRRVWWAVSFA